MGKVVTEHWVNAELSRVFAFFSDPANLPKLMPGAMAVRLEKVDWKPPSDRDLDSVVGSGRNPGAQVAGVGTLIFISFRLVPLLPFRGRWTAEIVEFEPLSYFVDVQRKGPMHSWRHRHAFRAEVRDGKPGTVVRDEVEYSLPGGVLGKLVDWLAFEKTMRMTFSSRHRRLEKLILNGR